MKRLNTGCVIALITGLICGFLAGSVAISSLASYRIDLYKEKIRYLESDIEEKNIKLEKYEDSK